MQNRNHFLFNLWRWKCDLPEEDYNKPLYSIADLRKSQMSKKFIELMENRMVMGTFRYGKWQDNKKNGIKYDRVGSIRKRLDKFEETGNTEYLVDIANLAMIEYEISDHPKKHFLSIDDGLHTDKI